MIPRTFLILSLSALCFTGCERKTVVIEVPPSTPVVEPVAKTRTFETARLGRAIDTYDRTPTAENHADVKKAFADLDGEIAELEALVAKRTGEDRQEAAVKLKNLQSYRTQETARFAAVEAKAKVSLPPAADGRSGGEKLEDAAKRTGDALENAGKKAGDAVKDIVR